MVYEFKFPDVGEGITEGKLVRWLVKENDEVKKEQALAEVETDKAVVEIPSPITAKISKLLYNEHDTIYVGKPMILFDDGTTNFVAPETRLAQPKPILNIPSPVKYYESEHPYISESKISIQQQSTPLQQPTMQQSVPQASKLKYSRSILPQEVKALPMVRRYARDKGIDLTSVTGTGYDDSITMKDLGSINGTGMQFESKPSISMRLYAQPVIQNTPQQHIQQPQQSLQTVNKDILASPSTRQYARESGLDISTIIGTGSNGMITRDDILKAKNIPQQDSIETFKTVTQQTMSNTGLEDVIPLNAIRQIIAKKLLESMNKTVQYTVSDEFDATELCMVRDKNAPELEKRNVKLTYLSFFVKAACLALMKNPYINSTMDEINNVIRLKKYYNIGIAVDTERGLIVPIIKDVEHRTIIDIAASIVDLAGRARNKMIKLDELTGGTFSITNVGSLAGQMFTPVINYPEAAILGIGRIIDKPVVKDGQIIVRKMVTLSLTADHRIIDGANASRFLMTLKEYIENPGNMLLDPN